MKFLLPTLLLIGGINIILARSIYWGPYERQVFNPWSNYDYDDELFALPSRQDSREEREFEKISKLFDKSSEDSLEHMKRKTYDDIDELIKSVLGDDDKSDSKEQTITKTSDERNKDDDVETLKDIESLFSTAFGVDDISEEETKNDNKTNESEENTKEKDDGKDGDNDDDDDEDNDDKKNDDDNSQEQLSVKGKTSSEETKFLDEHESKESKESNETLTLHKSDENDDDYDVIKVTFSNSPKTKFEKHDSEITEKDIRELTALLMTLSTLDDLMKIAEISSENKDLLNDDESNETNLKEVNDYLNLFNSLLDKIIDESLENNKETTKKSNNKNDKDNEKNKNNSRDDNDDDNDDDDKDDSKENKQKNDDNNSSVSLEFQDLEKTETNLNNHRYDIVQRSTSAVELKPTTSSPFLPETFKSNADSNNVIQEYVEVRDKIDTLQDNLLSNKLNMDRDFYNIIANENDDQHMKKFANDIAVLRENAYKIKQTVDDMQDIKSKLYFHKLLKTAVKEMQLK